MICGKHAIKEHKLSGQHNKTWQGCCIQQIWNFTKSFKISSQSSPKNTSYRSRQNKLSVHSTGYIIERDKETSVKQKLTRSLCFLYADFEVTSWFLCWNHNKTLNGFPVFLRSVTVNFKSSVLFYFLRFTELGFRLGLGHHWRWIWSTGVNQNPSRHEVSSRFFSF